MRSLILIVLALAIAGCSVGVPVAGHAPRTDFGRTNPQDWDAAFWEAVKNKDYAGLERHMTSNYLWTGSVAQLDKAAALDLFKKVELKSYSMSDVVVKPQGDDFVVSYTLTLDGTLDSKPFPHPVTRFVSVWQLQKKGKALITQSEWPVSDR